jgi:hypothetical protein
MVFGFGIGSGIVIGGTLNDEDTLGRTVKAAYHIMRQRG